MMSLCYAGKNELRNFSFKLLNGYPSDDNAKTTLLDALPAIKNEDIAIADGEAVRLLQLTRFRTDEMLAHAYEVLLREKHEEIAAFDHRSDPMSRLTWLRARASRVFDQIETIYLTHHFHGHAKFLGFTIPDGDGRDFQWTDSVAGTLHESIGNILALDDEAKASCELIHFDMADGDDANKRRLHYLVVYHPGKMRLLRQMKNRKRDLFSYIPVSNGVEKFPVKSVE